MSRDWLKRKKAILVVIAHDVDPIEIVLWLPCLCKKMDVPYVIVKSKSRLGTVVNRKRTACLAIQEINATIESEIKNKLQLVYKPTDSKTCSYRTKTDVPINHLSHGNRLNQIPGMI